MAYSNGFPMQTTAATGMFNGPSSKGYIVGQAQPDPSTRYALRGGLVDTTETLPMYGGCGIYANVPLRSLSVPLPAIGRATGLTGDKGLLGFAVTDQSYNLVIDPGNQVPAAGPSQTIGWYPLGCRARIAVACDPALIDLAGQNLNGQVSWDFTNQELIEYSAPAGALPVTVLDILPTGNMVPVYNTTTGTLSWNYTGAAALIQLTGGTVA